MTEQISLLQRTWEYDIDTATIMARCPECGGRMIISRYQYQNPYRFCPYCGERLDEGNLAKARDKIYS